MNIKVCLCQERASVFLEQDAEENIWTQGRGSCKELEKNK
jgi:hypothetical protein